MILGIPDLGWFIVDDLLFFKTQTVSKVDRVQDLGFLGYAWEISIEVFWRDVLLSVYKNACLWIFGQVVLGCY